MKNLCSRYIVLLAIIAVSFSSCKKEKTEPESPFSSERLAMKFVQDVMKE